MRLRLWLRQRAYTKHHRSNETDGIRLMRLDEEILPTFVGYRAWCDARLQECPIPSHDLCCYCSHSNRDPRATSPDGGADRG